ncbi:MAG TPA: hypothetical protein VID27_09705 [Blastocatellia bacterium]|jgi:hypothetical protein
MDSDPEWRRLEKILAALSASMERRKAESAIKQAQAEAIRAETRMRVNKLKSSDEKIRKMTLEIAQLVRKHESKLSQPEEQM